MPESAQLSNVTDVVNVLEVYKYSQGTLNPNAKK